MVGEEVAVDRVSGGGMGTINSGDSVRDTVQPVVQSWGPGATVPGF